MAHSIISGMIIGTALMVVAFLALRGHEPSAGAMIAALAAGVVFFLAKGSVTPPSPRKVSEAS